MAHIHRLIFFVLLITSSIANAAGYYVKGTAGSFGQDGPVRTTQYEACQAMVPLIAGRGYPGPSAETNGNSCWLYIHNRNSTFGGHPIVGASCPPNSIEKDGKCACDYGWKEDAGQCIQDPNAGGHEKCKGLSDWCSDKKSSSAMFKGKGESAEFFCHAAENFFAGAGGGGSSWEPAFPGCNKGCMIIAGGTTVSVKDDDGQWWTQGTGKYVGSTCDPNVVNKLNEGKEDEKNVTPPDSKDPGKCNGQQGTVNGVSVCLPHSEVKGDGNTKTETNSDGTKKETKTETKCSGDKCTTTTTTTSKDSNGNTTNTNITVTNTTKDDYCARNSGSSVCKALDPGKSDGKGDDDDGDKSSFGGSCSGGWTCEGDAIQCAVAREQHKRSCQLFEDRDNEAYKLYDAEKNKEGSVLGGLKGNKDIDISQYVNDRDDFIGGGSCPADRVIFFPYGEVTIPYSRVCPYAEMLGTVLIICAGIAGARIITRRD